MTVRITPVSRSNITKTPIIRQPKPSFGIHVPDYNAEIEEKVAKTAAEKLVAALRKIVPKTKDAELLDALSEFYAGLLKGSPTKDGIFEAIKGIQKQNPKQKIK